MADVKDEQLNAEELEAQSVPAEEIPAESVSEQVSDIPQAEEVTADKPEEATQTESAQGMNTVEIKKRKRKNVWGFVFTTVIFAFVVWALWQLGSELQGGNIASFTEVFSNANGWYLVGAAGLTLLVWVCDTLKYTLLNRTFGCSLGIAREAKLALTGKYYECITPTGTGGQPMQIYYMYKNGVSGGKSSSVVMMKYTVQMFAAMIAGAIVMGVWGKTLFNVISDGTIVHGVFIAGWVGFSINACAPIFVTFVIFCPKFLKWLINLGLVLLHKMHIVKRLDERRAKIYKGIDDFSVCSKFIFSHPLKFLQLLALCIIEPICNYVIPYFVIMALCGGRVADVENLFFTVVAVSCFSGYAVAFIPTPGTSAAAESVFMLAFASLAGEPIFWVTLVWRFFVYYVYIVMGVGMNITDIIRGLVRRSKEKKALAAANASAPPEEEKGVDE